MKHDNYEAPEITVLKPAINAIQGNKPNGSPNETFHENPVGAYEDWE